MFDLTSLDQRYAEHERRASRIDQDEWKRDSLVGPDRTLWARLVAVLPARSGRLRFPVHHSRTVSTLPPTQA